ADEIKRITQTVIGALDGCYDLLAPVGFSFGYRVSKEVFVYLRCWIEARLAAGVPTAEIVESWTVALDNVILQKVLPKIHGNRRSLGDSLRALSAYLGGHDSASNPPASYVLGAGNRVEISSERRLSMTGQQLARSRRKLDAMHDRLMATGYVSF